MDHLAGIEASKTRGLARVLTALSIRHVGETVADILADEFGDIDSLMNASVERLSQVNGIGPVLAETIHKYFHTPANRRLIEDLRSLGLKLTRDRKPKPAGGADFSGKTFVVTGTLENWSREEIEDLIKQHGGKATSSVSKNTDYVIAGEKAGSKLEKARKLGVPVLSEGEFAKLIGG